MKSNKLISIIIFVVLYILQSCEIKEPFVNVTDITVDKNLVTMVIGDEVKLNASISPLAAANINVVWSSNNESVVTVDNNGLITAHMVGNAVISVKTVDGRINATSNISVIEGWISLSENSIEAITTGGNYNLKISASHNWIVESLPQWISVSPSSGSATGADSTSLVVTFSQIDSSSNFRSGNVIFKLNNEEFADTLEVNQYNYAFSDGEYATVQSSSAGKGIDLVFMGDGYTITDIRQGEYEDNLLEAIFHFFNLEPFKTYRNYFNAHIVYAFSEESGVSDHNATKKTKFSTKYESRNSTLMSVDLDKSFEYALKAPLVSDLTETTIIIITNSSRFAGTNYFYSDGRSVSVIPVSSSSYPNDFRGVLQHEAAGHGFGRLADEYVTNDTSIPADEIDELKMWQEWGYFLNVDVTNNLDTILWNYFIDDPDYSYVGAYEGGYTYASDVWRPEPSTLMNNNIPYINAPGRELIVRRIKDLAGEVSSFEEFKRLDVRESHVLRSSATLSTDKSLRLSPPVLIEVD